MEHGGLLIEDGNHSCQEVKGEIFHPMRPAYVDRGRFCYCGMALPENGKNEIIGYWRTCQKCYYGDWLRIGLWNVSVVVKSVKSI